MKLVRWNPSPSRDLTTFQDEVTRLFDEVFARGGNGYLPSHDFVPALDVEETKESFVVHADLPGMTKDEIKINIADDVLTIRGERKRSREANPADGNLRRVERMYGAFERRVALDAPVQPDGVKAIYRDGVLEIQVPKAAEARVHEIEVQG